MFDQSISVDSADDTVINLKTTASKTIYKTGYYPLNASTLQNSVSCTGIGLHAGDSVTMQFLPAPAGTGIVFRRVDLIERANGRNSAQMLETISIAAKPENVSTTRLGTTISNDQGVSVATIEHVMAALAGYGIDNVIIEIDAGEVPIMDGSSAPFLDMLDQAGVQALSAPRLGYLITDEIILNDGDRTLKILPNDSMVDISCHIHSTIAFEDKLIGVQSAAFTLSPDQFKENISAARTFCNMADVEAMQNAGLARGGSMDNAIVLQDGEILNEGGLRFQNEFASHKALDLLGDLYLLGMPIIGRVEAYKPGHDINTRLAQMIKDSPNARIVDMALNNVADHAVA